MANPEGEAAYHGGGLNAAAQKYPDAPKPWLDLSTGVNPVSYPFATPGAEAFSRLPEPETFSRLEAAAAKNFGLSERAACVAAPGTQALLQILPRLIVAHRVGLFGFTYAEHGRCWRAAGADVFTAESLDDLLYGDVAVIVNPNNPDGRRLDVGALAEFAQKCAARGKWLVVDEAFADFLPGASLAPLLPLPGVVVLRSFGKWSGLAGVRLGFAVGPEPYVKRVRQALGPWAVSGVAAEIGAQAYADAAWAAKSAARLAREGEALDELLREKGFEPIGGTPLFRLVRHARATEIFARLCRAGILVRPFAERPDCLRFGIPGGAGLTRLRDAL